MLNTPQDILDFKEYQNAGGLQQPASYHSAIATIPLSEQAKSQLSGAVNNAIDYDSDGINELPSTMTTLSNEADEALVAANAMVTYLSVAANPTDIEQVAIGVGIVRKLAGIDDNTPAPSILPITNSSKIIALHTAIANLHINIPDAVALMSKINTALTPAPAIPPALPVPVPPLTDGLKQQALSMIITLKPFLGSITSRAINVGDMVGVATTERDVAITAFNDCIAFTMLSGQKQKPSVSDAANALYPKMNS